MDPLYSCEFVDIDKTIKKEPIDDDIQDESKICIRCTPHQTFPTAKDKILHDFFQHAEVTSVMESSQEVGEVEIKKEVVVDRRGRSRPARPTLKPSSSITREQQSSTPVISCDLCSFTTQFKPNIEKHMTVKHIAIIPPKMPKKLCKSSGRVCLVCGQTLDRMGSLRKHYVKMHGELLNIKSVDQFSFDVVKSTLARLKKSGEWTEPKRVIPVKRTKKYRHLEYSESSDDDTDEYYKNYRGTFGVQIPYHSSSDEYEEIPRTAKSYQCEICLKYLMSRKSLKYHIKTHEKKGEPMKKEGGKMVKIKEEIESEESDDSD